MLSDEAWKALAIIVPSTTTIVFGFIYRLTSHREHRKTGKQVNDIYILMNGETQKKIQEAYEKGRKDERQKQE